MCPTGISFHVKFSLLWTSATFIGLVLTRSPPLHSTPSTTGVCDGRQSRNSDGGKGMNETNIFVLDYRGFKESFQYLNVCYFMFTVCYFLFTEVWSVVHIVVHLRDASASRRQG